MKLLREGAGGQGGVRGDINKRVLCPWTKEGEGTPGLSSIISLFFLSPTHRSKRIECTRGRR